MNILIFQPEEAQDEEAAEKDGDEDGEEGKNYCLLSAINNFFGEIRKPYGVIIIEKKKKLN